MPKRPNPFGESSPLQMKSHISAKEVHNGDKEEMEFVFEKTKSLLFEGSKKELDNCTDLSDNDFMFQSEYPSDILKGQLRLDAQCHLYSDTSNDSVPRHPPSPASMDSNSMDTADHNLHSDTHLLPGQLTLGPGGQLQCSTRGNSSPRKVGFKLCHVCSHGSATSLCKCSYCEKDSCVSCLHRCSNCDQIVCKLCSNVNYEDFLERPVCFYCMS